jgi:hypothetical protein
LKRSDWLHGHKDEANYCDVCGELAGDINRLCAKCKEKKDTEERQLKQREQLLEYAKNLGIEGNLKTKEALLSNMLTTEEGLNTLARNIANPVRQNTDYNGIFRRFMEVRRIREDE